MTLFPEPKTLSQTQTCGKNNCGSIVVLQRGLDPRYLVGTCQRCGEQKVVEVGRKYGSR